MRPISKVITTLGLATILAPVPALAQQSPGIFDLRPGLTKQEFEARTAEIGSALRFRQLADPATIGRGSVTLGVDFADTVIDDRYRDRAVPMPRAAVRFGVSDRVDIGAWGGYDSGAKYGVAGIDTTVALMTQGGSWPVSLSIRPSVTSLIGPSDLWVGNASIDLTLSRAFGPVSPYIGAAASGSLGVERSAQIHLDPVVADHSVQYAGIACRWRAFVAAAEVERGARVSYGVRIGTRF